MPNAKQTLTTLLSNIEAAFKCYSEEDLDLYKSTLNGALDLSTSNHTLIYGHQNTTIINSLRSTLQAVSERTTSSKIAHGAWNPIIAAVFSTLEHVVQSMDTDDMSSQVTAISLTDLKSSGQLKKISTTGGPPQKPSQKVETPQSRVTKIAGSSKPPAKVSQTLAVCPNDVISRVRKQQAKRIENGSVFQNLAHVKCVKPKCAFCVNLWMALDLTKCSEVKCHRKGTVCSRDGWNAHVFPTMWLAASKDHNAGLDFPGLSKYAPKPAIEGSDSASTTASRKRCVTYSDALRSPSPMDESPHSPAKNAHLEHATDVASSEEAWFGENEDLILDGSDSDLEK